MSDWQTWFPPLSEGEIAQDEWEAFEVRGGFFMMMPPWAYQRLLDAARPSRRWKRVHTRLSVRRYLQGGSVWRNHLGRAVATRPPFHR